MSNICITYKLLTKCKIHVLFSGLQLKIKNYVG